MVVSKELLGMIILSHGKVIYLSLTFTIIYGSTLKVSNRSFRKKVVLRIDVYSRKVFFVSPGSNQSRLSSRIWFSKEIKPHFLPFARFLHVSFVCFIIKKQNKLKWWRFRNKYLNKYPFLNVAKFGPKDCRSFCQSYKFLHVWFRIFCQSS